MTFKSLGMLTMWRRRLWVFRVLRHSARGSAIRRYLEPASDRAQRLASATLGEDGRLVFVCHGNIMRSAFATRVVHARFPAQMARVVSGGTHARAGRSAQEVALAVAAEMQLPMPDHRATPLDALVLRPQDVVVCMDALNEANVLAAYPTLWPRVFRVGDIVASGETIRLPDRELHDPYARGEQVTRGAFKTLVVLSEAWARHLFRR